MCDLNHKRSKINYLPPRGKLDPRSTFFKINEMSRHEMVGNGHVSNDRRKFQV